MLKKLKKFAPWLLILSGCMIIGSALFQRIETIWRQNELVRRYEQNADHPDEIEEPPDRDPEVSSASSGTQTDSELPATLQNPDSGEKQAKETVKLPEIIGTLRIPRIGVRVAIGEGSDDASMRYTVGHFTQTALPGQKGNFALIGHRSYRYGQFFNRLDELKKGDELIVKRGKSSYTYTVAETFVVEPEDTWVLNPTPDATITLVTCTPIRIATHRLIVKGILKEKD